jgi:glycosyltransferase involved in cell wall biosynthesis
MINDLTICIPTSNNHITLGAVLSSLSRQYERLKVLISDNGSCDGTWEMLQMQIKNKYHAMLDIELFRASDMGCRQLNITSVRRKLCSMVMTPYLMFLDSDVLLAPRSIPILYNFFLKEKDTVGLMGIRYEPTADHVQVGAAMMESKIAKLIDWDMNPTAGECECKTLIVQLGRMTPALGTKYHPELQARHLKFI